MDFGYGPAFEPPTPGMPGHELLLPSDLRAVALETSTRLALPVNMVVRDYFIHRLLGAVAQVFPPGDAIAATAHGEPVEVAGWGFGGGTSLVSGHRLVERFSEDIDLVVYVPRDFRSRRGGGCAPRSVTAPLRRLGRSIRTSRRQLAAGISRRPR